MTNKKHFLLISCLCLTLIFAFSNVTVAQNQLIDPEIEQKIDELLSQMTLEEKAGQLNQHNGSWDVTGPIPENNEYVAERARLLKNGGVGSLLNVVGAEATLAAQKLAVENSRLGIPLIFGYDVIHGFKTIFPIPLGESASWDLEAIEQSARVAAIEASAAGINWTFAPMVDVGRDPRWGRVMEGSGEDPFLGSEIARARVRGFQTDDLSTDNSIMATAKHFAGYGFSESGRDYNTVDFGTNTLFNIVLPTFEAAVDEGVGTIMNSFNDLNGIPANGDTFLQRTVLKERWGFDGFVISDWGSIRQMINHGYSKDLKQSAYHAITSGNDMDMESEAYQRHLVDLVESGKVDEAIVDQAVRRVLRMKFNLGLFDDPYQYSDPEREAELMFTEEHRAIARDVARKSIVLMNNERDLLPLSKETKKIAVIGHLAAEKDAPLGNWRAQGDNTMTVSLLEGIRNAVSDDVEIEFVEGYTLAPNNGSFARALRFPEDDGSGFANAIKIAATSDVVIMAVGEEALQTGEGRSLVDISLQGRQLELFNMIREANDNVVVVLMAGRPIIEPELYENAHTLLNTWHLGSEAGNAIADVIFGDYNPSGKLPMSVPRAVGQIPVYYNFLNPGRPSTGPGDDGAVFWSHYNDIENTPQYPFGYGLSYTTFEYSAPELSSSTMNMDGSIQVSVEVSNTGDMAGEEVVQMYIRDHFASVMRPVKELRGFEKVMLDAGETKTITFDVNWKTLGFYGQDQTFRAEPGMFSIMIGGSSDSVQSVDFELVD
ncbi:MAG: beta-glucosidase BglX [Balneolaceae bacterium]|nr:beta-glucosidase BglX [Balneolaceae bacterium]